MAKVYQSGMFLFAGALLAPMGASADPLQWSVGAGAIYSDNWTKAEQNPKDDIAWLTQLGFSKQISRSRLQLSLEGDLENRDYQDDVQEDRLAADVALVSSYEFTPNFLWRLEDRLSDVSRNSIRPDTPDNQERLNIFKTGPEYTYMWSGRQQTRFSLEAVDVAYETDGDDSQRLRGGVEHSLGLNETLAVGVLASGEYADIKDALETETQGYTTGVFTRQVLREFNWFVNLGYTRFELQDRDRTITHDGLTGRLETNYIPDPKNRVRLSFDRVIADASSDEILDNFGSLDSVVTVDMVTKDRLLFVVSHEPDKINLFRFRTLFTNDDYQEQNLRERKRRADVSWLRRHSVKLNSQLSVIYRLEDQSNNPFQNESLNYQYRLGYYVLRNLALNTYVKWSDGTDGDNGNDYEALEGGMTVVWNNGQ